MSAHSLNDLQNQFLELKSKQFKIDMTRGKPSAEQLDLSNDLLHGLGESYTSRDGTDVRNYGGISGLIEARELMGQLISVEAENTIVYGNSSLTLMYLYIQAALGEEIARLKAAGKSPKFLAPSPGYDRHFWICQKIGVELILVPFTDEGPDMGVIEDHLSSDANIVGMWCVPKHSNPTGHTYSPAVVERMAKLPMKAQGPFTIMWDDAYAIHDLSDSAAKLASMREASKRLGTEDSIAIFGSTSKVTFAGAGLGAVGLSSKNFKMFTDYLGTQSIGPDKVSQLQHARFFTSTRTLSSHMKEHARILLPKFNSVLESFQESLGHMTNVSWSKPEGGYFISLYVVPGTATRVVELAKELGVALTPAGSAFPNGKDPLNSHIRIAPSCPTMEQIKTACTVITLCVQLAAKEKA